MGLTLAVLGHGGIANAQVAAIQGTGTVDAGLASIDSAGGTVAAPRTNVRVDSPNAVINWAPTDTAAGTTPIDFLPANGLAYFYSVDNPDFIVLNRVIPATTRQIGLNGEVRGTLDVSGTTSPGGNVWFYSPTGFVAGTGSRFSANGLILTANDIPYTSGASGGGINFGAAGEIQMTAPAGSQANVTLLPGSRISNTSDDAYTLIVAPSIVQGGTIELDGSVGLIAAESVSVLIQNSLFDIDVQIGTSVADAIIHTGSTGAGAAADTLAGPQHVVVMATPANSAITVLLGGEFGATTVNAINADRSVILSGGYDYNDISGGGLAFAPDTATPVNIRMGTSNYNADLTALTTGSIIGNPSRSTAINFLGNASLTAGTDASLAVDLDETIAASQNLSLQAPVSAILKLGTTNSEAGSVANPAIVTVQGNLTLNSDNFGVDPAVDAVAGTSTLSLDAGPVGPQLTVFGNTLVTAVGFGAEGPTNGGNGFGGTAQIIVNGGTLSLTTTDILADGLGSGGTPGGSGTGGLASFTATDAAAYSVGDLRISANGTAGDSFDPTTPFGIGTGGTARFVNQGTVAAAANSRSLGNLVLQANGDAGSINGQPGVDAVAGLVQLSDLASGANGHARFASVSAQARGLSAPAGSGALIESAGGTTTIDSSLDVDSAGTVTIAASGNGTISAADLVSISSASDIVITHTGQGTPLFPTLTGGDVIIDAGGNVDAGPGTLLSSAGTLLVRARSGSITADSLASVDSLDVHALGNVLLKNASTTGPVTVRTDGSLSGGQITITAGVDPVALVGPYQPVDIVITGLVNASGQLDVHAGRDILGSGGPALLLEGQAVKLIGERDISGANLTIRSRSDLNWLIGRNLLADTVDVAGQINMINLAGTLLQAGRLDVNGSLGIGNLILRGATAGLIRATGDLTIGRAQTTGLDVATPGGVLTLSGLQAYPNGASGFLTASAPTVSLAEINVSGNINATATSTSLAASNLSAGGAVMLNAQTDIAATNFLQGGSVTLTAPGSISLGTVTATAGNIIATPGGALNLLNGTASGGITLVGTSVTLGGAQAGGLLSVSTPGIFTVNGQASGATVRASSSDVVIGPNGRIGAGTTSLVELTNNDAARRSYYGGAGNSAGYSLSGSEMGQLFGTAITLIAPQTAQSSAAMPEVTIGDMTVSGAQLGAQGTLTVQTAGRVLINGAANFTGLGNGNTFAIRAGELIMLDNQAGSIDLRGANNALAGRIDFSAGTIMAVSSPAQAALANLSDPAAIDRLLGTNGGRINDTGVLRADSMLFAVTDGLYIQNTGTSTFFPFRRGFSVGSGGIAVSTPVGRTTPLIVVNGQATTSAGDLASGLDTIPLVSINGQPAPTSSGSRSGSTINGCDFTNIDGCRPPLTPEITLTRDRVQNAVEEQSDTPSDLAVERQSLVTPDVELQDIGRLSYEPLIDEPVTGSGNDDLWVPECDPGKQGDCPAP